MRSIISLMRGRLNLQNLSLNIKRQIAKIWQIITLKGRLAGKISTPSVILISILLILITGGLWLWLVAPPLATQPKFVAFTQRLGIQLPANWVRSKQSNNFGSDLGPGFSSQARPDAESAPARQTTLPVVTAPNKPERENVPPTTPQSQTKNTNQNHRFNQPDSAASPTPQPKPLPHGRTGFTVAGGKQNAPRFERSFLDPMDPELGTEQNFIINVSHAQPISAVKIQVKTDNQETTVPMKLTTGSPTQGTWQGSWTVKDTYLQTYQIKITAIANDSEQSTTLTLR
jgi:hypothetical protein